MPRAQAIKIGCDAVTGVATCSTLHGRHRSGLEQPRAEAIARQLERELPRQRGAPKRRRQLRVGAYVRSLSRDHVPPGPPTSPGRPVGDVWVWPRPAQFVRLRPPSAHTRARSCAHATSVEPWTLLLPPGAPKWRPQSTERVAALWWRSSSSTAEHAPTQEQPGRLTWHWPRTSSATGEPTALGAVTARVGAR